jgi:hypothetical protein
VDHPFPLSEHPGAAADRAEQVKKSYDWTLRTTELLSLLMGVLSETVKAWDRFNCLDGDIGYFSDIDASPNVSNPGRSLRAIKEAFEKLRDHQHKLQRLKECCDGFAQAVSYNPLPLPMADLLRNGVR